MKTIVRILQGITLSVGLCMSCVVWAQGKVECTQEKHIQHLMDVRDVDGLIGCHNDLITTGDPDHKAMGELILRLLKEIVPGLMAHLPNLNGDIKLHGPEKGLTLGIAWIAKDEPIPELAPKEILEKAAIFVSVLDDALTVLGEGDNLSNQSLYTLGLLSRQIGRRLDAFLPLLRQQVTTQKGAWKPQSVNARLVRTFEQVAEWVPGRIGDASTLRGDLEALSAMRHEHLGRGSTQNRDELLGAAARHWRRSIRLAQDAGDLEATQERQLQLARLKLDLKPQARHLAEGFNLAAQVHEAAAPSSELARRSMELMAVLLSVRSGLMYDNLHRANKPSESPAAQAQVEDVLTGFLAIRGLHGTRDVQEGMGLALYTHRKRWGCTMTNNQGLADVAALFWGWLEMTLERDGYAVEDPETMQRFAEQVELVVRNCEVDLGRQRRLLARIKVVAARIRPSKSVAGSTTKAPVTPFIDPLMNRLEMASGDLLDLLNFARLHPVERVWTLQVARAVYATVAHRLGAPGTHPNRSTPVIMIDLGEGIREGSEDSSARVQLEQLVRSYHQLLALVVPEAGEQLREAWSALGVDAVGGARSSARPSDPCVLRLVADYREVQAIVRSGLHLRLRRLDGPDDAGSEVRVEATTRILAEEVHGVLHNRKLAGLDVVLHLSPGEYQLVVADQAGGVKSANLNTLVRLDILGVESPWRITFLEDTAALDLSPVLGLPPYAATDSPKGNPLLHYWSTIEDQP